MSDWSKGMNEAMDKAKFEMAVAAERQRQVEKGYTAAHDDEKGAKHLINWACDYIVKGEPVKAVALLVATLQHLERRSPAPLPDRETLARIIQRGSAEAFFDGARGASALAQGSADAVLAALSTQPAAGEVEWEYAVADPAHDFAYMVIAGKPTTGAKAMRRRKAGPWEHVPQPPDLFPGTLAALDNLSIRPEVQ